MASTSNQQSGCDAPGSTGLSRSAVLASISPASRTAATSLASMRSAVEAFSTVDSPTRTSGAPQRLAFLAGESRGDIARPS